MRAERAVHINASWIQLVPHRAIADSRTISTCKQHGIPCPSIARKVRDSDFTDFDYILAMDQSK